MPRGYHPCFRDQTWSDTANVQLIFDSDGNAYRYTAVPQAIFDQYSGGTLNGTEWNATIRATIGPYVRLN